MTYETEFYDTHSVSGYKTIVDADEIAQEYISGKTVLIHFPSEVSWGYGESYLRMVGYAPAVETSGSNNGPVFVFAGGGNLVTWDTNATASAFSYVDVDSNGKLFFHVYVD